MVADPASDVPKTPSPETVMDRPNLLEIVNSILKEAETIEDPPKLVAPLESVAAFNPRKGVMYSCSDDWRKTSGRYKDLIGHKEGATKLFHNLGGNIFLDKSLVSPNNEVDSRLRMSLWFTNGIMKKQKAGGRFSVTFDLDALTLLKENMEDIERALTLCDTENFLGYALHLGHRWYCTVERQECSVHFRRWWSLSQDDSDPLVELLPSRDGLKLGYDQFSKFKLFVMNQLEKVLPKINGHLFCCDRPSHQSAGCTFCNPRGLLPFQKHINQIMGSSK